MLDLAQTDFAVNQCDKNSTSFWNFSLPIAYSSDPTASITFEKVEITSPFLAYNSFTRVAFQTQFIKSERTDFIKIELEDSNGFSGTFTLSVSFGCPERNPISFGTLLYKQYLTRLEKDRPVIAAKIDRILFNGTVMIKFNTTLNVPDRPFQV